MRLERLECLSDLPAAEWNTLVPDHHPFLSYEFLSALERHGCVGAAVGWQPWHIICRDDEGRLLGAAPLYLKTNSYGEFVFDWGWAEAYRRQGLPYYPKLVSAIPYTPATSPRLLLTPQPAPTTRDRAGHRRFHAGGRPSPSTVLHPLAVSHACRSGTPVSAGLSTPAGLPVPLAKPGLPGFSGLSGHAHRQAPQEYPSRAPVGA